MTCEICRCRLEKDDIIEHRGFVLCEDCYIEALQLGCGWAPFREKFGPRKTEPDGTA